MCRRKTSYAATRLRAACGFAMEITKLYPPENRASPTRSWKVGTQKTELKRIKLNTLDSYNIYINMKELINVDNRIHKSGIHSNEGWMDSIKCVDIEKGNIVIRGDKSKFLIRNILNNKEINKIRDTILNFPHNEFRIEVEIEVAFKCFLLKYDKNINKIIQLDSIGEEELIVFRSKSKDIINSVIHKGNNYIKSSLIQGNNGDCFLAATKDIEVLDKLKKNTKYISLDKGINIYRKDYDESVLNDLNNDRLAHYFRRDDRRLKSIKRIKNISGNIEKYREYDNEGEVIKFANNGVNGMGKSKPVFSLDLHGFTVKWAKKSIKYIFR